MVNLLYIYAIYALIYSMYIYIYINCMRFLWAILSNTRDHTLIVDVAKLCLLFVSPCCVHRNSTTYNSTDIKVLVVVQMSTPMIPRFLDCLTWVLHHMGTQKSVAWIGFLILEKLSKNHEMSSITKMFAETWLATMNSISSICRWFDHVPDPHACHCFTPSAESIFGTTNQ